MFDADVKIMLHRILEQTGSRHPPRRLYRWILKITNTIKHLSAPNQRHTLVARTPSDNMKLTKSETFSKSQRFSQIVWFLPEDYDVILRVGIETNFISHR